MMNMRRKLKVLFILAAGLFIACSTIFAVPQSDEIEIVSGNVQVKRIDSNISFEVSSPKAIINMDSFNINQGERVEFLGPDSEVLARVVGGTPSHINGDLYSDLVLLALINEAGIHIGETGNIDARGLVLSTRNISDTNFINGDYLFERMSDEYRDMLLLNEGKINIYDGGFGVLIAGAIENKGLITARLGTIALASGNAVKLGFSTDGLISVAISEKVASTVYDYEGNAILDQINNSGTLSADGGYIILKAESLPNIFRNVINLEGCVHANRFEEKDGKISIVADGNVVVNTEMVATDVEITAKRISSEVTELAEIEAEAVRIEAEKVALYAVAESLHITKLTGDITVSGVHTEEVDGVEIVNMISEDLGRITYLKSSDLTLEAPKGAVNTSPGVVIPANQVKISAQKIGSVDNPVGVSANTTYINRLQGIIDISEMWGMGSTITIRGPAPDGAGSDSWGAVSYLKESKLILQAQKTTLSGESAFFLYGDITFHNFELIEPNKWLYFEPGKTYTFKGKTHIQGETGNNNIRLYSAREGESWHIKVDSSDYKITLVEVKDSVNIGEEELYASPSVDKGNNQNWLLNTVYWIGEGSTTKWYQDLQPGLEWANWTGDPTGQYVRFDGVTGLNPNKDCNINVAASVSYFIVESNYTGTITQNADVNITNYFHLRSGAYTGISGTLTIDNSLEIWEGATFTAPPNLHIGGAFIVYATTPGSFVHNSGNVKLFSASTASIRITSGDKLWNLELDRANGHVTLPSVGALTVTVENDLTLTDGSINFTATLNSNGYLEVLGDVILGAGFDGGTGTLYINDPDPLVSDARTLDIDGVPFCGIRINDEDAVVNLAATSQTTLEGSIYLEKGTINQGAGKLLIPRTMENAYRQSGGVFNGYSGAVPGAGDIELIEGNFHLTDGTFNSTVGNLILPNSFLRYAPGVFDPQGGTVQFVGGDYARITVALSGVTFSNFILNKDDAVAVELTPYGKTITAEGTLSLLNGKLDSDGTTSASQIKAEGDIIIGPGFDGGDGVLWISDPDPLVSYARTLDIDGAPFCGIIVDDEDAVVNLAATTDTVLNGSLYLYKGTVNQGSGKLTIIRNISAAYKQTGGIFNGYSGLVGGEGDIQVRGYTFYIAGGTFNSTKGTLRLEEGFRIDTSGNFVHNEGTVEFVEGESSYTPIAIYKDPIFYNLTINEADGFRAVLTPYGKTATVEGTLRLLNGKLDSDGTTSASQIKAEGDIIIGPGFDGGDGVLWISDPDPLVSYARTLDIDGAPFCGIIVDDEDAVVNLAATQNTTLGGSLYLYEGVVNQGSGKLTINRNISDAYKQTGGTFNGYSGAVAGAGDIEVKLPRFNLTGGTFNSTKGTLKIGFYFDYVGGAAGGTLNHSNGTVEFYSDKHTRLDVSGLDPDTEVFWDVIVNKDEGLALQITGDAVVIGGDLTLRNGSLNVSPFSPKLGVVNVKGDLTVESTFDGVDVDLIFSGDTSLQTLTLASGLEGMLDGPIEINKSSGRVLLASDLVLDAVNQTLDITSGVLDVADKNLTVTGDYECANDGVLRFQGIPSQILTFGNGFDIDSGTAEYVGNGDGVNDTYLIRDFGTTAADPDYFNLRIASSGTAYENFNIGEVLDVNGFFYISSGNFRTALGVDNYNMRVGGDFTLEAGALFANTSVLTFDGVTNLEIHGQFLGAVVVADGASVITNGYNFSASSLVLEGGAGPTIFDASDNLLEGGASIINLASYLQEGGMFTGGSETMTVEGSFTQSAGTFQAPATLEAKGDFDLTGGGTYASGNMLKLIGSDSQDFRPNGRVFDYVFVDKSNASKVTIYDNFTVNKDLTFQATTAGNGFSVLEPQNTSITITVYGDLEFPYTAQNTSVIVGAWISSRLTIDLRGDLGKGNFEMDDNNANLNGHLRFTGPNDQTIDLTGGRISDNSVWTVEKDVNNPSYKVSVKPSTPSLTIGKLVINEGEFIAPTDNLVIQRGLTITDGGDYVPGEYITFAGWWGYDISAHGEEFNYVRFNALKNTLDVLENFTVLNNLEIKNEWASSLGYAISSIGAQGPVRIFVEGDVIFSATPGKDSIVALGAASTVEKLTLELRGDYIILDDAGAALYAHVDFVGSNNQFIKYANPAATMDYGTLSIKKSTPTAEVRFIDENDNPLTSARIGGLNVQTGKFYAPTDTLTINRRTFRIDSPNGPNEDRDYIPGENLVFQDKWIRLYPGGETFNNVRISPDAGWFRIAEDFTVLGNLYVENQIPHTHPNWCFWVTGEKRPVITVYGDFIFNDTPSGNGDLIFGDRFPSLNIIINLHGNLQVLDPDVRSLHADINFQGVNLQGDRVTQEVSVHENTTVDGGRWTITATPLEVIQKSDITIGSDAVFDIDSGAIYDLNGYGFNYAGTFYNDGTLRLQGAENVSITNMDTDSGTVEYISNGDGLVDEYALKDFGDLDYYNLSIISQDADDVYKLSSDIAVVGEFRLEDGIFSSTDDMTLLVEGQNARYTVLDADKTDWASGSLIIRTDSAPDHNLPSGEIYNNLELSKFNTGSPVFNMGTTINGTWVIGAGTETNLLDDVLVTGETTVNGTLNTRGYDITSESGITIGPDPDASFVATDTLEGDGTVISLEGNWSNVNNNFTASNDSEVIFTNAAKDSQITGTTVFHDLTCTSSGKTLKFAAGQNQTIQGDLTLDGALDDDKKVFLRSTSVDPNPLNRKWYITVPSVQEVYDVDVGDSDALGANILALDESINSGFNDDGDPEPHWVFPGNIYYWVGSTNSNWNEGTNWSFISGVPGNAGVPDNTIYAIFDAGSQRNCDVDVDAEVLHLGMKSNNTRSLIFYEYPLDASGDVTVNGGRITHKQYDGSALYLVDIAAQNFTLASGAIIDANIRGYPTGDTSAPGYNITGGASHGGLGGGGAGTVEGVTYGNFAMPVTDRAEETLGSGTNWGSGQGGGGAVKLVITGDTTIDGLITANGGGGNLAASGGSVYINSGTLSGGGTIQANGGRPGASPRYGGGGGRVAVVLDNQADFTSFTGKMTAYGGEDLDGTKFPHGNGAAGTVYKKAISVDELIIDNNDLPTYLDFYTVLPPGTDTIDADVIVTNRGVLRVDAPITITGSLQLLSGASYGGMITHKANSPGTYYKVDIRVEGDLILEATSSINASSRGYARWDSSAPGYSTTGGASHGGVGRGSNGSTYGDFAMPVTDNANESLGSGTNQNGAGGGAIKLDIAGSSIIDGAISANGGTGNNGSSGGSIYIKTGTLSGTEPNAVIEANGGNGNAGFFYGGGGGRVAVELDSQMDFTSFAGRMTAYGGVGVYGPIPGYENGAAGTVYRKGTNVNELVIDNGLRLTNADVVTELPFAGGPAVDASGISIILQNGARLTTVNDVIAGSMTINFGTTLNLSGDTLTLSGDWTNNGGSFVNALSTVAFTGTGISSISGETIFNNLTCVVTGGGKTLEFEADKKQTINGTLTLNGGALDEEIVLISDNPGSRFQLEVSSRQIVYFLEVSDSEVVGSAGNDIIAKTSINRGNTDHDEATPKWLFGYRLYWIAPIDPIPGVWREATNWRSDSPFWIQRPPQELDHVIFGSDSSQDSDVDTTWIGLEGRVDFMTVTTDYTGKITQGQVAGGDFTVTEDYEQSMGIYTFAKDKPGNLIVEGDMRVNAEGIMIVTRSDFQYNDPATALDDTGAGRVIQVAGDLTVDGLIHANSQGFNPPGAGDPNLPAGGAGPGTGDTWDGASHGGIGENNTVGITYGSVLTPQTLGSSGGGGYRKGSGGGAIRIIVGDTLTVNGAIEANGQGDSPTWSASGAGSGGSIWIACNLLEGNGTISADGGDVPHRGSDGSGGGGRVAVYYNSTTFDDEKVHAHGGDVPEGYVSGGAAGTVYLKNTLNNTDELIIDNNGIIARYRYTVLGSNVTFPGLFNRITLRDAGYLYLADGLSLDISDPAAVAGDRTGYFIAEEGTTLTVPGSNWTISDYVFAPLANRDYSSTVQYTTDINDPQLASANVTVAATGKISSVWGRNMFFKAANLTLDENSSITVNSKGYYWGGPGADGTDFAAGGYGGQGGNSSRSNYGSITDPIHLGSGPRGVFGGGAMKLVVPETLTVSNNSTISANGENFTSVGGSGGSIHLDVGTLNGAAVITGGIMADGGRGSSRHGGGGGRIAIHYTSYNYDDAFVRAYGAGNSSDANYGAAGTVYINDKNGSDRLIINNGGSPSSVATRLNNVPDGGVYDMGDVFTFGTLIVKNHGYLFVQDGVQLNVTDVELSNFGEINLNNNTLRVYSDWTNNGGLITATGSTVEFVADGDMTSRITGDTYFTNFRCVEPGKTLLFKEGDTFRMRGAFELDGGATGTEIVLNSQNGVDQFTVWVDTEQIGTVQYVSLWNSNVADDNPLGVGQGADINVLNCIDNQVLGVSTNDNAGPDPHWAFPAALDSEPEPSPRPIPEDPLVIPVERPLSFEPEGIADNVALGSGSELVGAPGEIYGFDLSRVDTETEPGNFYSRWYTPGAYVSRVHVNGGSITLTEYSNEGAKGESTRLTEGEDFEKEQPVTQEKTEIDVEADLGKLEKDMMERCSAEIVELGGEVLVRTFKDKEWVGAEVGMKLRDRDIVKTGEDAFAVIKMTSTGFESVVLAKANTSLMILGMSVPKEMRDKDIVLDVSVGEVDVKTTLLDEARPGLKVKTAGFILDAEKSDISLYAFGKENVYKKIYIPGDYVTKVTCFEGSVYVRPYDEEGVKWDEGVIIGGGEEATAKGTIEEKAKKGV